MPTIFSHAFVANVVGSAFTPKHQRGRFTILTALCAILPDADVVSFAFGFSYRSVLGHRGITHSLVFALLVGGLIAAFCFRGLEVSRWKVAAYFSLVTFSHPLLDMLTNGGLGVALLAPFSEERFFLPWRPVRVSPIGVGFFSERGAAVILSELVWIWLPSIAIGIVLWTIRLVSNRNSAGASADSPASEDL